MNPNVRGINKWVFNSPELVSGSVRMSWEDRKSRDEIFASDGNVCKG